MEIAAKHQKALERIKKNITKAHNYFQENCARWHEFQRFIGVSALTAENIKVLESLNKPQIQFNILEAYISRLMGEFSKQQPSIKISAATGKQVNLQLLTTLEGNMRHIEYKSKAEGTAIQIYSDLLKGGFSVAKVKTCYKNNRTFAQELDFDRVYDPTLCGFDPVARLSDKSDGRFAFELFPMTKDKFKNEHPNINLATISFSSSNEEFRWSYKSNTEDILLIADYYEKKIKRKKIVLLANGQTMVGSEYTAFLEKWTASNIIMLPPAIIKERMVEDVTICRYRFIENQVLEYIETDYKYFPLVFFDGNSVRYREPQNSAMIQFTRPYPYHAKGMQQLKNFAGQTLANELENLMQTKVMMPEGGIPDNEEDAYKQPQLPNVMFYKQYADRDAKVPLNPPQIIPRSPAPPEIAQAFTMADQMTQTILGSYDASLGINNNQLSGIAIVEGATQSNAAAMPYIVNYLQGFNQVARIILDLTSKYMLEPRMLPTMEPDGTTDMSPLNQPGGVKIDFDSDDLNIEVTAGVSFAIQKTKALQQVTALMQASTEFTQFINTQKGLRVLLDNLEIKGVDQLKGAVDEYFQQKQQQQQMMMQQQQQEKQQQMQMVQQAQQNDPLKMAAVTDRLRLQQNGEQKAVENQLKGASLGIDQQKVNNDKIKLAAQIEDVSIKRTMQQVKEDAAIGSDAVETAIKAADLSHRHHKEALEVVTKVRQPGAKTRASKETEEAVKVEEETE